MSRTSNVRSILALASSIVSVAASPAWSQQPQPAPAVQQLLLQRIPVGTVLDRYLESLRNDFFVVDADADGQINQRDIDLHTVMEDIQVRTNAVRTVMRYDLDGDGFVTEDEVRRGMTYDLRVQLGLAAFNKTNKAQLPGAGPDAAAKQIDHMVRTIVALDADNDGKVSMAEAAKFGAPTNRVRGANGQAERARQLLTIDGASKGTLTLAEYQAAGESLFRQVDTDKDGVISQQELSDFRARAERVGCEMPAASEKAKVVMLSSYETEALSSVTLGLQDNVVHAGRVVVEPGSEPLYVVIASYSPTIWQFSGAVERVERLVMTSSRTGPNSGDVNQRSLVGATGIAPERVHFFNKSNCLTYFNETPSSASLQTIAAIRSGAGKAPETVAAKYSVASFKVPSGAIESVPEQKKGPLIIEKTQGTLKVVGDASNVIVQAGPSRAKDEMYRFSPGGVIEIDVKAVVSSVPATPYEVLPQQAGLVQLIASGALRQNSLGEYIVREKIRFPAGLYGAHSVTFLVMKGTPYPDGDPGHSCVIVEETGEKKGGGCRR
ncbi:EF-hand domain-containing protein [Bradyrhizobium sp. sGM-13]|uniref:EF-hand domain-containing protein n=1 Tax=Bradyrhizobium sp. sGM-13 TaxID=2831781 RepID=UPI001BCC1307|nr:EF-hand domain-containing protein [Bradyrhizobium sp. sGM-13]